jgi:lipopolysaccharide transport system permease protein
MPSILPPQLSGLLRLNPAYLFTHAYQNIFFHGIAPNMKMLIALAILGHVLLAAAVWILRRLERDVRDFI